LVEVGDVTVVSVYAFAVGSSWIVRGEVGSNLSLSEVVLVKELLVERSLSNSNKNNNKQNHSETRHRATRKLRKKLGGCCGEIEERKRKRKNEKEKEKRNEERENGKGRRDQKEELNEKIQIRGVGGKKQRGKREIKQKRFSLVDYF